MNGFSENVSLHLVFLLVSLTVVAASLIIPVKVDNRAEMEEVRLGYPMHFVTQDISATDPPSFPRRENFQSPWENPAVFQVDQFLLSALVVLLVLELSRFLARYGGRRLSLG